jgi:alkaline phosphatase
MRNESRQYTPYKGSVLITILIFIGLAANIPSCSISDQPAAPQNIILMIGDGMGTDHIHAGRAANGGTLHIEDAEYTGFQKTHSASSDITDSGASATAMATGVKTYNRYIGVDAEGNPKKTILELAEDNGLSTGLIATSTITHATPASFAAHIPDRGKYEEIAEDISNAGIDLIFGGGWSHFRWREDGQNLLEIMEGNGYFTGRRIEDIPINHEGPVAILTDSLALPKVTEGRGRMLEEATSLALTRLSLDRDGFFLMVEGSQIDWAAHKHDTDWLIEEVIDFDRAVGRALDFARLDGETLVIITADHETGGFRYIGGGPEKSQISATFSTKGHTGVMVPVFAYGPGAELFTGIYENTRIFDNMVRLLDLE